MLASAYLCSKESDLYSRVAVERRSQIRPRTREGDLGSALLHPGERLFQD